MGAVLYYALDRRILTQKLDEAKKEWTKPLEDWEDIIRNEYMPDVKAYLDFAKQPNLIDHNHAPYNLHIEFQKFKLKYQEHASQFYNESEPGRIKFNLLREKLFEKYPEFAKTLDISKTHYTPSPDIINFRMDMTEIAEIIENLLNLSDWI
uniref:Uncharacterized protein n=1 Tax=Orbilia brochopaga TaxID=3140254 RepID=A0A481ZQ89_9PEZI|nr:hypothetical protein [Drechslerella brochopaga]QBL02538.1 hypothetical protein [Drechslerella brochopaga]